MILHDPSILGKTIPITFAVDDDIDSFLRGYIKRDTPESDRRINDKVINFVDILVKKIKLFISLVTIFLQAAHQDPLKLQELKEP